MQEPPDNPRAGAPDERRLEVVREPPPDYDDGGDYPTERQPPNTEKALLGALLLHPHHAPAAHTQLASSDFTHPVHEQIWDALHHAVTAGTTDPVLVATAINTALLTNGPGRNGTSGHSPATLPDLITAAGDPLSIDQYIEEIRDKARIRNVAQAARRVLAATTTAQPGNIDETLQHLVDVTAEESLRFDAGRPARLREHVDTIDELLTGGEDADDEDWVIPGLLERQDRLIITAGEGDGKSTLLRQIATTTAAGIHPFSFTPIDPQRVLVVDVENSRRQSRRRYRPLRVKAGHQLDPDLLRIRIRLEGLDLTTSEDCDWLLHTCQNTRPDLLIIGPIYKLANGDPTEEKSAKPVAVALDRVRAELDCAIILEAHAAKATGGQRKRPHEPYGWSGWMRWPEFGLWLDKDGSLTQWRGGREERLWPTTLIRGGEWPWTQTTEEADIRWQRIERLRTASKGYMSYRDVEKATGYSTGAVSRIIGTNGPHHDEWVILNGPINLFTEDQ